MKHSSNVIIVELIVLVLDTNKWKTHVSLLSEPPDDDSLNVRV